MTATDHPAPDANDPDAGAPATADPATADPATPDVEVATTTQDDGRGRHRGRTRFVFMDTEATGLDHRRHELTEVSWVVRFEDGREEERRYFPEHTTDGADDDALILTHHAERIAPQPKTPAKVWLTEFLEHADGAILVGAVPDFDARHLERMCHKLGLTPTWDHHLLDVETLALPLIAASPEAPRSLAKTCAALGIPHDKDQAHGALYDAQQAMRVFDRVWELLAQLRADDAPLPPAVPRESRRRGHDGATPAQGAREPEPDGTDAVAQASSTGPGPSQPDGVGGSPSGTASNGS